MASPPFQITPKILKLSIEIAERIGRWDGASRPRPKIRLRKENRIKTVQSSVAIEGNTLTLDQVTALFENKRVLGPQKDIREVQNALEAYRIVGELRPDRENDFLRLHSLLMKGLASRPGHYRSGQVGIFKGSQISHVAPPAQRVPVLMGDLFRWIKQASFDAFVLSSIAHYEIEFIHPFEDGNGRMGRLWQHLILQRAYPLFEYVPIEVVIRKRQKQYYSALEKSDRAGEATIFVEFMLEAILEALSEMIHPKNFESSDAESRLSAAKEKLAGESFTRQDYMNAVGQISTATASRDLRDGVKNGSLKATGTKKLTRYRWT